jgi:hypothetical protein
MTMRYVVLLLVAVVPLHTLRGEPPKKEEKERLVRPVLWWSGLGRISDGGGRLDPSSALITDAEAFAKLWKQYEMKGEVPAVNFADYFVVADFRALGLTFEFGGGLVVGEGGDSKLRGLGLHPDVMNSQFHSTTIAVFPREGVKTVAGKKLPAAK